MLHRTFDFDDGINQAVLDDFNICFQNDISFEINDDSDQTETSLHSTNSNNVQLFSSQGLYDRLTEHSPK